MKGDNIIDSRDVIKRIEELEEEHDSLQSALEDAKDEENDEAIEEAFDAIAMWRNDNKEEYEELLELAKDGEKYSSDWSYGSTLIHDNHFREYAEELAEECCDMKSASEWPFCCIDWNLASDALKIDYTEIDFGGESYWIR